MRTSWDDVVDAGTGFDTHPHRDMEIVTWVLEGSLVHQDSTATGGQKITATEPAEILVWEMHTALAA